jgi:hypothetical protein
MTLREHCEWAEKVSGLKIELKRKTTPGAQNSFYYTHIIIGGTLKSPEVNNDDNLKWWLSGFIAGLNKEREINAVVAQSGRAQPCHG